MKPDWKDAPEWAEWMAMDSDGNWYWYETRPSSGRLEWASEGRAQYAPTSDYNWNRSLEARP